MFSKDAGIKSVVHYFLPFYKPWQLNLELVQIQGRQMSPMLSFHLEKKVREKKKLYSRHNHLFYSLVMDLAPLSFARRRTAIISFLRPRRDLIKTILSVLGDIFFNEKHTKRSSLSSNLATELTRWGIRPTSPRVEACVPLSQQLAY